MTHTLKTWPGPFAALLDGTKTYEIRKQDRDFKVGDVLNLLEFVPPAPGMVGGFTGRGTERRITYMTPGGEWGLPDGLCVLALASPPAPAEGEREAERLAKALEGMLTVYEKIVDEGEDFGMFAHAEDCPEDDSCECPLLVACNSAERRARKVLQDRSDRLRAAPRPPSSPDPARRLCRCEWPKVSESMKGLLCPRCGWPREAPAPSPDPGARPLGTCAGHLGPPSNTGAPHPRGETCSFWFPATSPAKAEECGGPESGCRCQVCYHYREINGMTQPLATPTTTDERMRRAVEEQTRTLLAAPSPAAAPTPGSAPPSAPPAVEEPRRDCTCTWTADFVDHGEMTVGAHHSKRCPMYDAEVARVVCALPGCTSAYYGTPPMPRYCPVHNDLNESHPVQPKET